MGQLKRFLIWVGFIRRKSNGSILWPFHISSWWVVKHYLKYGPRFYIFRNKPGVIKWRKGRLLPRRWGFGFCGIEFGDRG